MEKGKNVVKRGRPFKTNANAENGSKRARAGDATDDSWVDFIPLAAARQYRKEMEDEEVEIEEVDAGDGVRPKKRDDTLYFRRTSKEFVDMIPKLNPRQVEAVHEIGFGGILDYKLPEIPGEGCPKFSNNTLESTFPLALTLLSEHNAWRRLSKI